MQVSYSPLIKDNVGNFSAVRELAGDFSFAGEHMLAQITQKIQTLERILGMLLPSYEIPIGGSPPLRVEPIINSIICSYFTMPPTSEPNQLSVLYYFRTQRSQHTQLEVPWDSLSRSQQLAVGNIASWVKNKSWEHLANKIREVSGQSNLTSRPHKVFISYKRNSKSEEVAEVVAHRLSQQGMNVWFDKWEVMAGDSVPGRIGEGFKDSDACLIFMSREYSGSNWCTKEMNTALTKAINEHLTIIPSLIEPCDVPELLKDIKRVDFIEPTASEFEKKLAEVTDAIYKVDLNPYR